MAFHPYSLLFAAPKPGPAWAKSKKPPAYDVTLAEARLTINKAIKQGCAKPTAVSKGGQI
jgi:hypothetical protein